LKNPGAADDTAVMRPPPSMVGRSATQVSWRAPRTHLVGQHRREGMLRACSSPSPSATISLPFGKRKKPKLYSTSHGGSVGGRWRWMKYARRTSSAEPSVSVLPSFRAMNATLASGEKRASQ
jgi:hypothetical protein